MDYRNTRTAIESVVTIANGDLQVVVWRDKNGRQVLYRCEEMDATEIARLIGRNEVNETAPAKTGAASRPTLEDTLSHDPERGDL